MKTAINFDTRLIANREYREFLEESPGFHLAAILRELADECDQLGFLPMTRELTLEDGTPVGDVVTLEGDE